MDAATESVMLMSIAECKSPLARAGCDYVFKQCLTGQRERVWLHPSTAGEDRCLARKLVGVSGTWDRSRRLARRTGLGDGRPVCIAG